MSITNPSIAEYGHFKEQEQNMFSRAAKFMVAPPTGFRGEHFVRPETAMERLEHTIGHEAITGTMSAEEGLEVLAEASRYLDGYSEIADDLRFGGTTTVAPSVQARL